MDISYKNICRITLPVLFSMLVEQIIGITGTAFLGHVGEVELGASAIAGVCYLILYVTGSGFGTGLQVLIARLNGRKQIHQLESVFSTGFYSLIVLSLGIIILSKLLIPFFLGLMIKSDDVYKAACVYLNWRVYGLLFAFIIIAFRAYYVGITKTRFITIVSVVMVFINILFDYILIFGKCGIPALGIEGAAIGSCIAELVAAVLFFCYYWVTHKGHRFERIHNYKKQWVQLKRIMNLSTWTMLQSFLSLASWLVFFVIIEHIGKESLAISNVVRSISAIPFMITLAFASTGSSLVSNLIGEGKGEMVLRLCQNIMKICFVFCVPFLIIGTIIPLFILQIYTNSMELINDTLPTYFVMLSSHIVTIPAYVYYLAISGTGNTFLYLKYGMVAIIIYVLYILFLAKFAPNIAILWTSEHVYSLALLLLSVSYLLHYKSVDRKI